MYTQCPQCLTVFLLDAAILGAGRGDMRCGRCGATFSALDAIADDPPGDGIITPTFPSDALPVVVPPEGDLRAGPLGEAAGGPGGARPDQDGARPVGLRLVETGDPPERESGFPARRYLDAGDLDDEDGPAGDGGADEAEEAASDEGTPPRFSSLYDADDRAFDEAARERWGREPDDLLGYGAGAGALRSAGTWRALALVLALVLGAQVLWYERERLLHEPALRPWLEGFCEAVGCRVPLRRDLALIRLASRDIRAHPSVDGALIINATLQNEAPFRQAWPDVLIRLSDLEGRPVAARRFEPVEYLERGGLESRGMAPGSLVPLVFEVVDPGPDAVAFEFDFR